MSWRDTQSGQQILAHYEGNTNDSSGNSRTASGSGITYDSSNEAVGSQCLYFTSESNTSYSMWAISGTFSNGTVQMYFMLPNLPSRTVHTMSMYNTYDYLKVYLTSTGGLSVGHYDSSTTWHFLGSMPDGTIKPNVLYHISYTWGSNGQHLYIDGHLELSNSNTANMYPCTKFGIGHQWTSRYVGKGYYDEYQMDTTQHSSFPKKPSYKMNGVLKPSKVNIVNTNDIKSIN